MAQVSRRTRIIRRVLIGVLAVSVVVAAVAIKNRIDQGNEVIVEGSAMQPNRPPVPTMSSAGSDPSAPLKNGSAPHAPMTSASPQQPQATSTAAPQGSLALIISLITSVTSVLGLLMSKYTEWQRARLEQMKLAIELQRKDLAARLSTTALPFSPCRPRGQASASKTERPSTALNAHRMQALSPDTPDTRHHHTGVAATVTPFVAGVLISTASLRCCAGESGEQRTPMYQASH